MTYDIITVGGGLGGSALAMAMAQQGKRVLVLENETKFRDRVRGEQLASWGAAEAKELGIYDLLLSSCAHEEPWWDIYIGGTQIQHRNMVETTPQQLPNLRELGPGPPLLASPGTLVLLFALRESRLSKGRDPLVDDYLSLPEPLRERLVQIAHEQGTAALDFEVSAIVSGKVEPHNVSWFQVWKELEHAGKV